MMVNYAFEMASAFPTSSGGYTQNVYPYASIIASALLTQSISGCPYCELPRKRWGAKITLHIMEGQDIVKLFQLTLRRI